MNTYQPYILIKPQVLVPQNPTQIKRYGTRTSREIEGYKNIPDEIIRSMCQPQKLQSTLKTNTPFDGVADFIVQNRNAMQEILAFFPAFFFLLVGAFTEPKIPFKCKAIIGFALAYAICPVDIIPSCIPILGQIDDMYVLLKAFQALFEATSKIDEDIIGKHWKGTPDGYMAANKLAKACEDILTLAPLQKTVEHIQTLLKRNSMDYQIGRPLISNKRRTR